MAMIVDTNVLTRFGDMPKRHYIPLPVRFRTGLARVAHQCGAPLSRPVWVECGCQVHQHAVWILEAETLAAARPGESKANGLPGSEIRANLTTLLTGLLRPRSS